MCLRSHFSLKTGRGEKAGETEGKEVKQKGMMPLFGVCSIIVHSIQVYIEVYNLTTSEKVQPIS